MATVEQVDQVYLVKFNLCDGEILDLFTTARHSLNILKFNINSSQDIHLSEQIFRLLDFIESKLNYKLYTEKEIQLKKIKEVFKNLKEIIYN